MSIRKQAVTAGVLGLFLAFGIIAGAAYILPQSASQIGTSNQVGSGQSSPQTPQSNDGSGTLAVLLTDPPTLPAGVTAVYITYGNVAVHVSGAGNQSGWTNSNTSGTLNIVKLVNVSSTIAKIKVTAGTYNALRFNISSALVTYNGKNYTAFVPRASLTVPIPGGIAVNATKSSAAIIDMHPTVVNIGSTSTPEFIINNAASGYCIPSQNVTGDMGNDGFKIDLLTAGWWQQINERNTANVSISSATLKTNSFSVTVKNTGSTPLNLSALFIAPLGKECETVTSTSSTTQNGHHGGEVTLPTCLTGTANYLVLNNGTLVPITATLQMSIMTGKGQTLDSWALLGKTGYQIGAGKSVTLTYKGSISFGIDLHLPTVTLPGVISGDQYDITVIGQQALAATIVVAS